MATGLMPNSMGLMGSLLIAPPGTKTVFHQAAAPLGWVADATLDERAMRSVTGAGGGVGGSVAFSTWCFGGTVNLNAFTLSIAQLPVHSHSVSSDHSHGVNGGANFPINNPGSDGFISGGSDFIGNTATAFTGVTSPSNSTGSGASIQPSITTPQLKLAFFLMAVKS